MSCEKLSTGTYALAVREMPVAEILGQREAEVTVYLDLTQGRDPPDPVRHLRGFPVACGGNQACRNSIRLPKGSWA